MPWVHFTITSYLGELRMLIIGQSNKMLRDLRNSKGSRELAATSLEIVVSSENHNIWNLVFSLCMSDCLAKI